MIRVGITGSNGFLGRHLQNSLSNNRSVFKITSFNRDWFENNLLLDEFVNNCDIIVHLAGVNRSISESFIYETNIKLAENLIDSFNRTNFKGQVIYSSSIQENRENVFGKSKKKARELFSSWSDSTGGIFNGLIIPNVYGPFGQPFYNSVISTFCYQLVNNEIPKIENDVNLHLIYIDDLIKKIISLFNSNTDSSICVEHTFSINVSELLEHLKRFKHKYFENGEIPNLANQFELNLFNTFRSYINLKDYYPFKVVNNIDLRGNFVEIIRTEMGGQYSFSITKLGVTRGNHYHTRKIERFSVIKGKALIQLRKIGTDEIFNFYLSGDEPSYVDMPIWYTHNISNVGDEDLYTLFWINEFYDERDPDTFFEKV